MAAWEWGGFTEAGNVARRAARHPTELELEILKVLWRLGPSSGRQVRDALAAVRDLAYTSVMTILGIMTKKGYVRRSRRDSGYFYQAVVKEATAASRMLSDLVNRAFDGSAAAAMMHLLETAELDAEELKQLRQIIARKAKEQSP